MNKLATYTFLPWLRLGIANKINGQQGIRATIPIDVPLKATLDGKAITAPPAPIHKDIQIYGPGDIIGIDKKIIIKNEPRNWITNFEPNYLPYIDFYEEDFPWRYSPVVPDTNLHRLQPWMMLVVLKESEFEDGKLIKDKPLPFLTIDQAGQVLPDPTNAWAWAHIQINQDLLAATEFSSTDIPKLQKDLEQLLEDDPDLAYSRLVCPRKLSPNESYHAFLVPIFETGRLAGLGSDPSTASSAQAMAWDTATPSIQLPYYHRWYFRTGNVGDFEYLVRLLKAKPVDQRVGRRDMDVQTPGANLPGINDADLSGILKLGGALQIPQTAYKPAELLEVKKYDHWATPPEGIYPHPFQDQLAQFINLSDAYSEKDAATANQETTLSPPISNNPDPLITAPLYGQWHAMTQRLLTQRDGSDLNPNRNWIQELNLDPRWRATAGFGTKVVQENQETYMNGAWEQIGEVLEANRRIRLAQLAKETSLVWYYVHLQPILLNNPNRWLSFSAPMHKRIVAENLLQDPAIVGSPAAAEKLSLFYQIEQSNIPSALQAPATRKLLRPRGRLVQKLPFNETIRPDNLLDRVNSGAVSAAPPKVKPAKLPVIDDFAEALKPTQIPSFVLPLLTKYPWIKWMLLILAFIFLILFLFFPKPVLLTTAIVLVALFILLQRWLKQIATAESIKEDQQTPESVDNLPNSPNFELSNPGDSFRPNTGGTDSEEATRFKDALREVNELIEESTEKGKPVKRYPLDIKKAGELIFQQINPSFTIPKRTLAQITIPPRIASLQVERFVEAMAYPEFDIPMYKPLAETSAELFLPNINFIAQNSISLLETNQKFIEAYMVGLNHEFARELLWREYPTDQRGSYFRQFWEASSFLQTEVLTKAQVIAKLQQLPALRHWIEKIAAATGEAATQVLNEARTRLTKEQLRDIPSLHQWSKFSQLGDHDHRASEGDDQEEVVLVIRGELLKKYPTAVIYAHKAAWNYKKDDDGNFLLDDEGQKIIDPDQERVLVELADPDRPTRAAIKTPLYEAKVDPDIYFFGFDLTSCLAKGGTGKASVAVDPVCAAEGIQWDDPGWFFVIKERPGEPRFGLDVEDETVGVADVKVWNDLSWAHVTPAVPQDGFLQLNDDTQTIALTEVPTGTEAEKAVQFEEDKFFKWHQETNAAELAYILYQVPVLVAVHASEMLPKT